MTQTVTVRTDAEAAALVAKLTARFNDFSPFFLKLGQTVLPDAELAQWGRRFGLGLTHAQSTIDDRTHRRDYYKLGTARGTPDWPYFEWTGSLRNAASKFTTITPHQADVDPDANCEGPIEGHNPFSTTVGRLVDEQHVWDLAFIEPAIERALDEYVQEVANA